MRDFILKRVAALILPFVCVYGFRDLSRSYFSGWLLCGGIIVGLSYIAFSTIYGIEKGRAKLSEDVLTWTESFGTLWYGIMGMVGIFKGVPFLANKLAGIDLGLPGELFSSGLIS